MAKKHYSDITFYTDFVSIRPIESEGRLSGFTVSLTVYDEKVRLVAHASEAFPCDEEGYVTKTCYDRAICYGMGLTQAFREFQDYSERRGFRLLSHHDFKPKNNRMGV